MNIVLLGASGQLGQEWQQLIRHRDDVILFPYTSSQLDITNYETVEEELQEQQPDVVVNCAAYTNVDGAEDHRERAYEINTTAVEKLAKLSTKLNFTLVHYSTDYVFPGKKEDREACADGYPEDYPANPINYYGQTKWEGEKAIRRSTQNHLILRVSWLCGQFGSNFVKTMLRLGEERDQLQVVNDQWGSPTFTENVVTNTLHLLEAESTGTFHITSKGLISWYDIATEIFKQSGMDVEIERVTSDAFPTKAERPYFSKLSTRKLESVSGAELIDWRDGLKSLLSQLQNR